MKGRKNVEFLLKAISNQNFRFAIGYEKLCCSLMQDVRKGGGGGVWSAAKLARITCEPSLVPRIFSLAWAPRPQAREKVLGTRLLFLVGAYFHHIRADRFASMRGYICLSRACHKR